MTTPRDRRLAAVRARRQRLGQEPVERPSTAGRRYSEADIDEEAGGRRGKPPGTHATDLRNALRCHYGYSFTVPEKLLEGGSHNMHALRQGALAHKDPEAAAKWITAELDAEMDATEYRGQVRQFWHNELLSNVYTSWTMFGRLLALRALAPLAGGATAATSAASLLRAYLLRVQALLAILAVPGRIRNLQGRVTYEGPVVFAVGLRSIARREGNNARTPVASALLGGGRYVGDPGPLATAIQELANGAQSGEKPWPLLAPGEAAILRSLWDERPGSSQWRNSVESARHHLAGIRTAMHFQARVYADGAKVSMLSGPKGPSSTQEVRLVVVRGPEIKNATVVTPHAEGDERTVPASDAWIDEGRVFATLSASGPVHREQLPEGDPVLQLDTWPDKPESWQVRA